MSPTDLGALAQALSDQVRTLTAELQTTQAARDRGQRAEAAAQQAYKSLSTSSYASRLQTLQAQVYDQAMEDLRRLLAYQAVEIRDLTGRLDRASRQRDGLRDDNDHLLRGMALVGSEIHQLQSRIHGLERDLEVSKAACAAALIGSAPTRGGPPVPNSPPSSPNVALARLSKGLKDAKESIEKLSVGRDYALEEFVRMTQAHDEIQDKLTDTELQRDKAATEWADAKRMQTELESKIRRMSTCILFCFPLAIPYSLVMLIQVTN
ncbi:hypothetical protein PInf_010795 [Phytophthora infestans]|nr:hypothetical protein PInf_010795 [Phytophthora infestans]